MLNISERIINTSVGIKSVIGMKKKLGINTQTLNMHPGLENRKRDEVYSQPELFEIQKTK